MNKKIEILKAQIEQHKALANYWQTKTIIANNEIEKERAIGTAKSHIDIIIQMSNKMIELIDKYY